MNIEPPEAGRLSDPSQSPADCCRVAAEVIRRALELPPPQLREAVDEAENLVVQARDRLIGLLRRDTDPAAGGPSRWRTPLDRVNVALSLIAAVEYPAAGIQRHYLQDAEQVLDALWQADARPKLSVSAFQRPAGREASRPAPFEPNANPSTSQEGSTCIVFLRRWKKNIRKSRKSSNISRRRPQGMSRPGKSTFKSSRKRSFPI